MRRPPACEMRVMKFYDIPHCMRSRIYDMTPACEMGLMKLYELPYCMRSRIL